MEQLETGWGEKEGLGSTHHRTPGVSDYLGWLKSRMKSRRSNEFNEGKRYIAMYQEQ